MAAKVGSPEGTPETETSLRRHEVTRSRSDRPSDEDDPAKMAFQTCERVSLSANDAAIGRGAVIERYTILERLGAGGMATVYSAHDTQLDRIVALKLLRPHEDVAEVRARLFREAQAMARLSHPHVVTVYDVGVASDGRVFLSMEIVGGGTLKAWLGERKRRWPEIVKVLCEAGEGLAAAHSVGIVHRDFKLENVLIGLGGRPKVTDFGVASVTLGGSRQAIVTSDHRRSSTLPASASSTPSGPLTMAGAAIGTPGYMAPEQYEGIDEIDERADIFAFCATLYRALYGEGPFEGVTVAEIATATLAGQVRPSPKGSEVPIWLRRVLLRGLAVDRDARPASMSVLLAALRADPAQRRRRWLAAGAAVMAGCAVAWTVHASGQRRARECHAMADKLGGIWDKGRKESIENAFRSTRLGYADDTWNKIERALDGYTASWTRATEQACIATRVRGERSEAMLQLQSACLESRLDELRALSDVLAGADQKTVETAVRATQALSTIDGCTDLDRVSLSAQLPAEPSARTEIRALQGELAAAKALKDAGKPRQSLERLQAVQGRVERSAYGPLLVSWTMRVASDESEVDAASATADFERAVVLADAHRLDKLKTEAFIGLVRRETRLGHYEQSHRWLTFASAAITRIGGDTRLEALHDIAAGWLHVQEGKTAQAVPLFERAIAAARQRHLDDFDILYAYSGLSTALVALGRFDEGFGSYRAAIELAETELGPLHPSITRLFLNNLASDQIDAGRIADGLATASRTVALLEAEVQRGEASRGSRNLAIARVTLGQALLRAENMEEAIAQLGLARDAFKGLGDNLVVVTDNELGEAHRLLGHTSEANTFLNEASATTGSLTGVDPPLVAATLTVRAKIAMDRKNSVKAVAPAERALALLEAGPATIYALADARLLVARAIRARRGDADRARALAGQARDGFAKLGDQKRLADATALLEEIR